MRQVKIRSYRKTRHGFFCLQFGLMLRYGLYGLGRLMPLLPFAVIAFVFLMPRTPHLRVSYTYHGSYDNPVYSSCRYLGVHGYRLQVGGRCPLIRWIRENPPRVKKEIRSFHTLA